MVERIKATAHDGRQIPITLVRRKDTPLNGKSKLLLYAYGCYKHSVPVSFSASKFCLIDRGIIYAIAHVRGGGELGEKWYLEGKLLNKKNTFKDYISCAEHLIKNNYTSSDFLAMRGVSNGGLLVGATMTQRPDLIKVALPAVGVLDMLRYHKFTSGAGWSYDYGTSDESKEMFEYLKAYSPVHNVSKNTVYPATLITTGDHDDRVVPAHSFKFAAELQEKDAGINPVLIRIETNAGHGSGTPVSKTIEQYADIYGFTFYNMGFKVLPEKTKSKIKGYPNI